MTFWLVGCKGLLAKAFQKVLQEASLSYRVSSREECDITNPEEIERFASGQGIKYCINCSAYTAVDLAETHPEEALALNKQGVLHLGSFAGKEGIKMVHFSTDYVFNGTKKRPYTEEDLADPLSVYGKSKYEGEVALLQQYPTSLVVRVSWLFSEEMPAWNFTQKMLELLQLKPQLQVVSDQIGKVTYAEELARDILQLLPCEGLFHYAQSGIVSRYEYVQALLQVLQEYNIKVACREITPVSSAMFPGGAPRPSYSALDTTKVEGVLKRRLMSYKEALADCIKAKLSRGELHAG